MADMLSDSCRSEAHLSNVTSPRQEKTPAIDSAEPPERRIWHNSTKKHACLTNIMPVSKMLTAGVLGMQWGWRASFKQSLKKDKKCVTYKARLGDTGAWQVLHIDCEGRLAQFLSKERRTDYCRSKLNGVCRFLNRNRLVLNKCGANDEACVPVCSLSKYLSFLFHLLPN